MTCCGDPLITTPPPPPPPLGDKCARSVWVCDCIPPPSVWNLVTYECVDNNQCTGQISCTPLQSIIEQFNGCLIAGPLAPPPAPGDFFYPPCPPECCSVTTTTTTTTTLPPTTTTLPPTTTTLPPTTTTLPPGDQCSYEWLAECSNGAWVVTRGPVNCFSSCTPSPGNTWEPSGDPCVLGQTTCGNPCDFTHPCFPTPPLPDPPIGLPSCCTTTTPPPAAYCNCAYFATYDCDSDTWVTDPTPQFCASSPAPVGNLPEAAVWSYDTDACDALTLVYAVGVCD